MQLVTIINVSSFSNFENVPFSYIMCCTYILEIYIYIFSGFPNILYLLIIKSPNSHFQSSQCLERQLTKIKFVQEFQNSDLDMEDINSQDCNNNFPSEINFMIIKFRIIVYWNLKWSQVSNISTFQENESQREQMKWRTGLNFQTQSLSITSHRFIYPISKNISSQKIFQVFQVT